MPNGTLAVVTCESSSLEFDDLFREHQRLIYRTAFGITGRSEDAEDVLLRLLGREFPPDLKKNPRAYLYRAANKPAVDLVVDPLGDWIYAVEFLGVRDESRALRDEPQGDRVHSFAAQARRTSISD